MWPLMLVGYCRTKLRNELAVSTTFSPNMRGVRHDNFVYLLPNFTQTREHNINLGRVTSVNPTTAVTLESRPQHTKFVIRASHFN